MHYIVLTLGLFGRAQHPVVLFGTLYAPCGPFSVPYMRPATLFQPSLYAPGGPFCSRLWVRLCTCVSKSPKRFLNAGTQKVVKCTKNHEKIHRRSRDYFRRIRFIITGGMN